MPTPRTKKTSATNRRSASSKKTPVISDTQASKSDSLNNLLDFVVKIGREPDTNRQHALISEYAEKVTASEILMLPVDTNGHLMASKISAAEKEIYERMTSSLISCLNSMLKNRKHLFESKPKTAHAGIESPIVQLEYPKKNYSIKYRLRKKYIK